MRDNINKVAERGERLDSLQDKTGASSLSPDCDREELTTLSSTLAVDAQTISLYPHKDSVVVLIAFERYVACTCRASLVLRSPARCTSGSGGRAVQCIPSTNAC